MRKYLVTDTVPNATGSIDEVIATYYSFAKKMHEWETDFYQARLKEFKAGIDDIGLQEKGREDLGTIFKEYVLSGKRNEDRLENLLSGFPPEYSPDSDIVGEVIMSKKGGSITIENPTGLIRKFKLTLVLSGERYKIKKREMEAENGKWMVIYI